MSIVTDSSPSTDTATTAITEADLRAAFPGITTWRMERLEGSSHWHGKVASGATVVVWQGPGAGGREVYVSGHTTTVAVPTSLQCAVDEARARARVLHEALGIAS